jgi:hypothetical protein
MLEGALPDPTPRHPAADAAPTPVEIRTSPDWIMVVGAGFGGITLIGLFVFAFLAGTAYKGFICDSFRLLAAVFAFGAGLSAAFMGGRAAAQGQLGAAGERFSFAYALGGGVAFFVITFLLFSHFPPDNCEPPTPKRATLEFLNVPGEIKFKPHEQFWRKERTDWEDPTPSSSVRALFIRAEDERSFGTIEIIKDGKPICVVKVHMLQELSQIGKGNEKAYALETEDLTNLITLSFNSDWWGRWVANSGGPKAISPDCFRLSQSDRPLHGFIAISLRHGKFRYAYAKNDTPDDAAGDEPPRPGAGRSNIFATAAYAQPATATSKTLSFAQLKELLASSDPEVRIQARRFLGENFDRYKDDALNDLFNPDSSAEYLIALLHGLIAGIDKATRGTELEFGKANRNLDAQLPYIQDRYADIIRLTGHPDEGVKKQARRLIQRFPVSAFGKYYDQLRAMAGDKDCSALMDPLHQAQLYSSIFYFYNRIAQYLPKSSLTNEDIKKIEETSKAGYAISSCLEAGLKIDAESLNYAKFVTFGNFAKSKDLANTYAKQFVQTVENSDYYSPSHLEVAKRFIAKSNSQ